jgi:hypothetical protein
MDKPDVLTLPETYGTEIHHLKPTSPSSSTLCLNTFKTIIRSENVITPQCAHNHNSQFASLGTMMTLATCTVLKAIKRVTHFVPSWGKPSPSFSSLMI